MFHHTPRNAEVLVLCDVRTKRDANLDAKNKPELGAQSVLAYWWPAYAVWGERGWANVARVALFEFGQEVTPKVRAQAKTELNTYLKAHKGQFRHIIVLQSRSKSARKVYNDDYAEASHSGTVCWSFFDPPANIPEMMGCFWETPHGTILPLPDLGSVDYVYGAMFIRWLTAVRENVPVFRPPPETTWTEPGEGMMRGLSELLRSAQAGKSIAVDLETFSTEDLITVIGLSDGTHTCAVPWNSFVPHGQNYLEQGRELGPEGALVRRILATAREVLVWNGVRFDMPYMARKGIVVPGKVFDGFLAHGVLMSQFRHGLQAAVSYEFAIPPWKTAHRAAAASNGMDPDDATAWIQDPSELRRYNASDSMYTWWVCQQLKKYGGVG